MFALNSAPALYRTSGLLLLLAQFSLFAFGLPPFQAGIWYQSEPILNAIFIFAVLDALWLGVGIARGFLTRTPPHALCTCLLLWVSWQVVATVFAGSFWRSWFGPPEIGEGTGRAIALWLLAMLAYPLWQVESYRRIILAVAAFNIAAQCALHWFNPHHHDDEYKLGTWVPARFGAYLAFMAGNVWIAAITGGTIRSRLRYACLIVFTWGAVWISLNISALTLLSAAMVTSAIAALLLRMPAFAPLLEVGNKVRLLAVAACFLPMLWIGFSVCCGGEWGNRNDGSFFNNLLTKDNALGSRVVLNQVAMSTMQHEPARWLIGDGWGRFTDDIFKYALADGVHVYENGMRKPNWTPLEGSAFHSHDQPLEVLLSLGLPGLLLWFALQVVMLRALPKERFWDCAPMLVALVALYYVWFEMPQCLAYDALLFAALASASTGAAKPAPNDKRWLMTIVTGFAVAMVWSVWQQTDAIRYSETITNATLHGKPYENYSTEWLLSDLRRGGDRLHTASLAYGMTLGDRKSISANDRDWYAHLMDAAHIASLSPASGARVASTELWMQYKLLIDFGGFRSFADLGHQAALSVGDSVLQVCRKARLRDDYATMFLVNLSDITHNDTSKQEEILRGILAIAPTHRPAMWLLGKLLASQGGHEAEGREMMKRAAALRVDTVYPVTRPELDELAKP